MLLRRFMQHVKEQNWFAVGLDVIVVIVGIFLGMQVTEWNEARKESIQEDEYLELLLRDINSVTDDFKLQAKIEGQFVDASMRAVDMFSQGLPKTERYLFSRLVTIVSTRRTVRIEKVAFDELQNSGRLRVIQDNHLRESIISFFEDVERRALIIEKNSMATVDNGIRSIAASVGIEPINWSNDMDSDLRLEFESDALVNSFTKLNNLADPFNNPVFDKPLDDELWGELKSHIMWRARGAISNQFFSDEVVKKAESLKQLIIEYQDEK